MEEKLNIKTKKSKKNFEKNLSHLPKEKVEPIQLHFNLIIGQLNNKYKIKIKKPDNNNFNDSSISELITYNNYGPKNLFKYNCDYNFRKEQKLKIEFFIGNSNSSFPIPISIGEIVGNKKSTKIYNIKDREEKLEIKAEKLQSEDKFLTFHFHIKSLSNSSEMSKDLKEKCFKEEKYKLYFQIKKKEDILYESEAFTDDGKFNIVQIPLNILNSDFSILFLDYKNKILHTVPTSVKEITNSKEKLLLKFKAKNEYFGIYNESSIMNEITFLDYINNGVKIALDIGIDFTGSNGHPDDFGTLHCRRPDMKGRNPYERAILSCANIMANYDYDQKFPVYGFGAIINGQEDVSMCFNINFQEDPNIQYVDNIMKEYFACLDKITFAGPTHFAPIINKVVGEIKNEEDIMNYHVLMILTDGKIEDIQETVDALVEGSFLPLSVIIIGIGDNPDFKDMEKLDGDDDPLISSKGIKRQRDLVQFVPFKKFEGDEKKLTEEVLDEIPRQIIEYYTLNFLYPETLSNNGFSEANNTENSKISNINGIESNNALKNPRFVPMSSKNLGSNNKNQIYSNINNNNSKLSNSNDCVFTNNPDTNINYNQTKKNNHILRKNSNNNSIKNSNPYRSKNHNS